MKEIERTYYELGRLVGHLQSYASKIDSITERSKHHPDGRVVAQEIIIKMKDFNEDGKWFIGEEHKFNNKLIGRPE